MAMSSHLVDSSELTGAALRPSSWPVRRERQRIATSTFNQAVTSELAGIKATLKDMQVMNGPPGLAMQSRATECSKLPDLLKKIVTTHIPPLHAKLHQLAGINAAEFSRRLNRLEALFVCGPKLRPSVDEVLDKFIRDGSARVRSSSADEAASETLQNRTSYSHGLVGLPFVPELPHRADGNGTKVKVEVTSKENPHSIPARRFDIFDEPSSFAKSTQTNVLPSHRKNSCHGRAAQTDAIIKPTGCEVGVQAYALEDIGGAVA